jgi:hypothetical protein
MAKRSWEPRSYQVRDPRSTKAAVGRTFNPPRALMIGGRGESTLFSVKPSSQNQGPEALDQSNQVKDRGKSDAAQPI